MLAYYGYFRKDPCKIENDDIIIGNKAIQIETVSEIKTLRTRLIRGLVILVIGMFPFFIITYHTIAGISSGRILIHSDYWVYILGFILLYFIIIGVAYIMYDKLKYTNYFKVNGDFILLLEKTDSPLVYECLTQRENNSLEKHKQSESILKQKKLVRYIVYICVILFVVGVALLHIFHEDTGLNILFAIFGCVSLANIMALTIEHKRRNLKL
jgi:hypothetical protein